MEMAAVGPEAPSQLRGIVAGVMVVGAALWLANWTNMNGSIRNVAFTWPKWCGTSAVLVFVVRSKRDAESRIGTKGLLVRRNMWRT